MKKLLRRTAVIVGAAFIILSLLFVSLSPTVAAQSRPSARDLQAARQVWRQLKLAQGQGAMPVHVDNRMIDGLAALARDGSGIDRINAHVSAGTFRGQASMRLPLGLWLNASAVASGSHRGFPPVQLTLGRLSLPAAAGRPLANLTRWTLHMRGAAIPPLDSVVERFSVDRAHIFAQVKLPIKTGLVDSVIAARSIAVDPALVESVYCRLAKAQRQKPAGTLSALVRRTFASGHEINPEGYSRASFVALSLAVVGARSERLLLQAQQLRRKCSFPGQPVLLQGRSDLAKHWAFSAGLTSVLGPEAAGNLGEWKELDDSRPTGSGFSFVDLAADRAGVRAALLALEPGTAVSMHQALGRVTENQLLPTPLLTGPEGLSSASFTARYGRLEARDYRKAVSRIDKILNEQRWQRPH